MEENNLLTKLNKEYNIKVENGVAYFIEDNYIIAHNQKELVEFYIESFEYKYHQTFEGEIQTREYYSNIINELTKLI